MTESAYPGLTEAQMIFRDIAWTPALNALEAYLKTAAPWLNVPILSNIIFGLMRLAADKAFSFIVLFIDVTAIKFVNSNQQASYDNSAVLLKIISQQKGRNSEEYEQARQRCEADFSRFVRYGNS